MCDCASLSSPPPDVGAGKSGLRHCSLIPGSRRYKLRFHSNPCKSIKLLKDLASGNQRFRITRGIQVRVYASSGESSHRRVESDDGPVHAAAPLDDRLDFLGLKREVEKEESPSDGGEDVRETVEQTRPRRRVMKRSSLMAKQVISMRSARSLGFVSQLWVDTRSWVVVLLEARPNLLSGENDKFYLEDVCQVGDVVLVQDESWIENNELRMAKLDTLVGYRVITSNRLNLGKVRGYTFDINSGVVDSVELDSLGISIIPSSLVSTYCLFVEDVLEVVADTIVVNEDAVSRVKMLTKGFLDTPNTITSGNDLDGYSDSGKRRARVVQSRQLKWTDSKHQKAPNKMREFEDDWDLPMDY
ncbi:PRC-barrel-like protein [Dioscorea alata]|uniref:PRC-barrel-like protein n=1 Tax=Dioscorea alata TaxID=55571 RepID=A0ACB7V2I1_DIOAL|nr:PRC-barrel-like protein [Dioscorea alata]